MAVRLSKLLEVIPSDTEAVVARARDETNQALRERLRQLTGFRFGGSRKPGTEDDLADAMPVRVALAPGLPAELADKTIEEGEWALALLALHRPALAQLKGGSNDLLSIVPELLRDPVGERLLDGREVPLNATHHLAEDLLRAVSGFDLAKRILAVEGDVLGAYFPPQQRKWHAAKPPHIELYWAVIGLIAPLIGASTASLTTVVLAHELAHAFTQVGADIEGYRWEPAVFHAVELALKEGTAQYYTAKACERLERLAPDASATYKALLEKQPAAYRTHIPWLEEHKEEEVRLALVQARRSNVTKLADLTALLTAAKEGLRTGQAVRAQSTGGGQAPR
jgi:hypothetical protein